MNNAGKGIEVVGAVVPSKVGSPGHNPGGPGYLPAVCGPAGPQTVVKTANDSVKGKTLGNYATKPPRKM